MTEMHEMEVWQSNRLVEAAQTLTLNEKRLVILAAALHDPRKPLPSKGTVTFHADDFSSVFGVTGNSRYEGLADAARRLYNRTIRKIDASTRGKGRQKITEIRWVWMAEYSPNSGTVTLGFSPAVAPYLTMLHSEFTRFKLKQIGNIGSFYGLRMYELCAQYLKAGERTIPLGDLREMLDLNEKYPRLDSLRARVLDPALKEVNKHTDLRVKMTPIKRGRTVTALHFRVQQDDQLSLQLQEPSEAGGELPTTRSGKRSKSEPVAA